MKGRVSKVMVKHFLQGTKGKAFLEGKVKGRVRYCITQFVHTKLQYHPALKCILWLYHPPWWAFQCRPSHFFTATVVPHIVSITKTHQQHPAFNMTIISSPPSRTIFLPPSYCIKKGAWGTNIRKVHEEHTLATVNFWLFFCFPFYCCSGEHSNDVFMFGCRSDSTIGVHKNFVLQCQARQLGISGTKYSKNAAGHPLKNPADCKILGSSKETQNKSPKIPDNCH